MNQQEEFEAQQQEKDVYQPKYPYTWLEQEPRGALPRDEPPIAYDLHASQLPAQEYQVNQPQVPWWARPQPNQSGPIIFAVIIFVAMLVTLLLGALGVVGIVVGSLVHLAGVVVGALFAVLVCFILLVMLVLSLLRRVLRPRRRLYRRPPGV